jgi:hypothetical protein
MTKKHFIALADVIELQAHAERLAEALRAVLVAIDCGNHAERINKSNPLTVETLREALAQWERAHNSAATHPLGSGRFTEFTPDQISALANFCHRHNPAFNTEHWHDYIAGRCGLNGGKK